jgi:hypothetical protein
MTREELIARLEAATGPDRALDEEISRGVNPDEWLVRDRHAPAGEEGWGWDIPRYTASIDAAMALIPDGMFVAVKRYSDGWYARVAAENTSPVSFRGEQKPAAIALCIAAIKARA